MGEAIKILIIDDSEDDQLLYRRALTKGADAAFEIVGANDGDEGLGRLDACAPDCVLLDYSLPGRNGLEVLKRLRAAHPFLPVAMLTGQGNETVAVAAMHEGAQHYISKSSITPESIQRVVRVAIEHCSMQKRIHEQRLALEIENTERRRAEGDAQARLERLSLLHQITRAIGERQDLDSIFQVVVRSLEDQLPVDFACLCLYDADSRAFTVARTGVKNANLAAALTGDNARLPVSENNLEGCVKGELVCEHDISTLDMPFVKRFADAGLRSLVAAPLLSDGRTFALLLVAREKPSAFGSGDCEFARQLTEHVSLAAHQAQLYTALQQAYEKLQQTQQAVMQQERLRAVGQMASGIAHDINNALSPAALYTQSLLETEQNLSERARNYLETTQRAIEDVADTVGRLRDFYRQREAQTELVSVTLNDLVAHAIDLTRARWCDMPMQRGVVIEAKSELAPDLPPINGVASEIREALVNLILNAVDAMPEGGRLTLRTKIAKAQGNAAVPRALIEVADSGAGMDEETRRRCLEPFFTTKGERGTGLGLAMVYGIAQRHGAEIDVKSAPGQGTTISIAFPIAGLAPSVSPENKIVFARGLRLLLVDDDPSVLRSLSAILAADGHLITTANGGQEGIDALKAARERGESFSAVITDLGMPHVDGRTVAAAVKANMPAAPVILLTGWGQSFSAPNSIPENVDCVLNKPPRLAELRGALVRFCIKDATK